MKHRPRTWMRSLGLSLALLLCVFAAPVVVSPMAQAAIEDSVYFHNGGVKCTISLAPLDQRWDGHVTVLAEADARVGCTQAGPPYGYYQVNKLHVSTRLVVEDINGNTESSCGPVAETRYNVASARANCVGEAYLPYDCKWHAYATGWITENGVAKKVTAQRDAWVLGGQQRCT